MVCVSRLLEGVEEAVRVTVHTFYAIDATPFKRLEEGSVANQRLSNPSG